MPKQGLDTVGNRIPWLPGVSKNADPMGQQPATTSWRSHPFLKETTVTVTMILVQRAHCSPRESGGHLMTAIRFLAAPDAQHQATATLAATRHVSRDG